jgi:catalase (peroxidase I)
LAFHDAGEVDLGKSDTFGSDGCLSRSGDNSGLIEDTTVVQTVFIPMWQKYCDRITRADFFVLLGKLAAERADPTRSFNIPFQFGRKDNQFCNDGAGRLPQHQPGFPEFQRVFFNQMGLNMNDAVALLGAHTVGHVHPHYSGFGNKDDANFFHIRYADNAWDESPELFDNQYYKSLLLEVSEMQCKIC